MPKLTKRQVAEKTAAKMGPDFSKRTAENVIDAFFETVIEELSAGNEVGITGLCKFGFSKTKAIKKGTMVRNPSTGEQQPHPGKPAGFRVVVRTAKRLKEAAPAVSSKAGRAILGK